MIEITLIGPAEVKTSSVAINTGRDFVLLSFDEAKDLWLTLGRSLGLFEIAEP